MPTFRYDVLGDPGQRMSGHLEADTHTSAVMELKKRGLHILQVEEVAESGFQIQRRLSKKQIAHLTRQLSRLTGAGVPLLKALQSLENQADNQLVKKTLHRVRESVKEGSNLSSALEEFERSFGGMYISIVRAGEAGGSLDDALRRMAAHLQKELDLRGRVRAALAYPILMVLVGILTIFVLLSFVIPKITVLFDEGGQTLPLPTQILIEISAIFGNFWWAMALGAVFLAVLFRWAIRTGPGGLFFDKWTLRLPIFGKLARQTATGGFCRVLGTLLDNGVPMLQALSVTSGTLSNRCFQAAVDKAATQVRQGEALSNEIRRAEVFPVLVSDIIQVGEQSGELEKALIEVAEEFDSEVERTVRTMVSMLEPLLIIMIGGAVGFVVLALLLPIFELNEVIQ